MKCQKQNKSEIFSPTMILERRSRGGISFHKFFFLQCRVHNYDLNTKGIDL